MMNKMEEQVKPKSRRGFASMSKEQQRLIASKGGKAAHDYGKVHEWTSDEAKIAGAKGGKKAYENRLNHVGCINCGGSKKIKIDDQFLGEVEFDCSEYKKSK